MPPSTARRLRELLARAERLGAELEELEPPHEFLTLQARAPDGRKFAVLQK
jgi:hypothetical protein